MWCPSWTSGPAWPLPLPLARSSSTSICWRLETLEPELSISWLALTSLQLDRELMKMQRHKKTFRLEAVQRQILSLRHKRAASITLTMNSKQHARYHTKATNIKTLETPNWHASIQRLQESRRLWQDEDDAPKLRGSSAFLLRAAFFIAAPPRRPPTPETD